MKYIFLILFFLSLTAYSQNNPGRLLYNYPSSGSIGLQDTTYALNGLLKIPQTTAGVTLTIPDPSIIGQDQDFVIMNVSPNGTCFTLNPGGILCPGEGLRFRWSRYQWVCVGTGNGSTPKGANLVMATPNGSSGFMSLRALTANDIAGAGAITTEVDPVWTSASSNYFTKTQSDARYLQSFTETDPTVPSNVKAITGTNISNWNTAFGWGNHSGLYPLLSGSYSNPAWIISLPNTKITYSGITSQYVRGDGSLATFPTITNGTVTSIGIFSTDLSISGSPITSSGSITADLNTTGVSSGTYFGTFTVDTKGRITASTTMGAASAISSGGRNFNQAYQISSTRYTTISVSPQVSCSLSLTGGQAGEAILEISANGSSGWIYCGQVSASNTGTLTIGLNTVQISGGELRQNLPPGYYWRLRTNNTTGTPTFTFNGGNEITY